MEELAAQPVATLLDQHCYAVIRSLPREQAKNLDLVQRLFRRSAFRLGVLRHA